MKQARYILLVILLVGCGDSERVEDILQSDPNIAILLKYESKLPEEYQEVKECKNAIRKYITETKAMEESAYSTRATCLIRVLERNDSFVPCDYYIVWLGGGFLLEHGSKSRFKECLEKKIKMTKSDNLNTMEGEVKQMAKEILSEINKNK